MATADSHLPLYDDPLLYDLMRVPSGDLLHYRRLALAAGGPVLELACGTGRLTLGLAEAGVPMVGLDQSAAMIGHARVKAEALPLDPAPQWVVGDMRQFRLGVRFPLILITFNSLQHLLDNDSVRACLACVREHLEPGGSLAFDVLCPDPGVLLGQPEPYPVSQFLVPPRDTAVTVLENVLYDRSSQVCEVHLEFIEQDAAGTVLGSRRMIQTMRMFFPLELQELLQVSGFQLVARQGDFVGTPFGPDSMRQICLATPF
jgi:SAM-dependent methyltransferase